MTLVGTVLYGTTLTGGKHNNGSIFGINDDGTGYSSPLLFDFPTSAANNAGDMPFMQFRRRRQRALWHDLAGGT